MANILYISLNGMTESLGESQVVQYLLELSKNNVIYLFSFEKPGDKNKFPYMQKRLNEANIQWKYFEYSNRFGIFSTFLQIVLSFFVLNRCIRKEKIQIIHARSIIPAVIGMCLKKIFKVKLLYDIRGFAIDEKIMDGRLKENSFLTRLLKKVELSLYKNSDHIVTLTHASKPLIQEKYSVDSGVVSVIPTCASAELFKNRDGSNIINLKKELGFLESDKIILRNGSLNGSYDIEAEFKLFRQLVNLSPNIKILFLNKGQHILIESYLDKYQVDKQRCKIISVDYQQVASYINLADVCIFFVKPSFAKQASAPTKFAEMVASHLYSVTNSNYGDMEYYFNLYDVGLLLDLEEVHSHPEKSAEKIIQLLEKSQDKNQFDDLFQNHFSKHIAVEKYQAIYLSLVSFVMP